MKEQLSPAEASSAPILITTSPHLQQLVRRLEDEPVVAVDTESNSLYAYFYRVCLIQFSIPENDYLVDPLAPEMDLSLLADVFANPNVEKVLHAADNDILMLQRDYGFRFAHCFDTMLAARILGWRQVGLASILETHFGVKLDKRMQRTDWGHRPLERKQLAYAHLDTHFLLSLRTTQMEELQANDRWYEAQDAFAALEEIAWTEKPFDPDGFWHISDAKKLKPQELAVLQALYLLRDGEARHLDRPPFKVMNDHTLVRLAREQPITRSHLARIPGFRSWHIRQFGDTLLQAIARAQQAPPPSPPRRERNHQRPDGKTIARYESLRSWRSAKAGARGVELDVVANNGTLMALARQPLRTQEDLAQSKLLSPWKEQTYGPEILAVLSKHT